MDTQILIIVFAPLIAAIIAGLGNRMLGNTIAKSITTGGLFLSAVLSWPIFIGFLSGTHTAEVVPVLQWVQSGDRIKGESPSPPRNAGVITCISGHTAKQSMQSSHAARSTAETRSTDLVPSRP